MLALLGGQPGRAWAEETDLRAWGHYAVMSEEVPPVAADPLTIEQMICAQSWPCDQALRVARCESTMNPRAVNGSSLGLFQIHYPSHAALVASREALFDVETNIQTAFTIWSRTGDWREWSCKP